MKVRVNIWLASIALVLMGGAYAIVPVAPQTPDDKTANNVNQDVANKEKIKNNTALGSQYKNNNIPKINNTFSSNPGENPSNATTETKPVIQPNKLENPKTHSAQ